MLASASALALGASACGGDDGDAGGTDEERARATVETLYEAMADYDAEGVCAQLSEAAREQIAQGGLGSEGGSCTEGFEGFFEASREAGGLDAPLNAEVRSVDVEGDTATANVNFGPGRNGEIPLVKVDDEWKLEAAGAQASGGRPPGGRPGARGRDGQGPGGQAAGAQGRGDQAPGR